MIISHKHKFIFVKTRKTAGTSIEVALSRVAGEDAVVTPIYPGEQGHAARNFTPLQGQAGMAYFNHMSAPQIRSQVGSEIWREYFKVCFERNPWSKVASLYWWRTRKCDAPPAFSDWLLADEMVRSDWPLYSIEGKCAMDMVGRYEQIGADVSNFLEHVGISSEGFDLPFAKSGFRRHSAGLYSSNDAEYVRQIFHREVASFDYDCPAELLK